MEKKLPQIKSFNIVWEETIPKMGSEIIQNSESIFCFQRPINKKAELAIWALQDSHFLPCGGIFQNEKTKSMVNSIISMGSTAVSSSSVVSNQNIIGIDKCKVRSFINSPVFSGEHLNSFISKNQWESTKFRDLGQNIFQVERAKLVSDSMLGIGSYVQNSSWVPLNQNILENGNFKIDSDRISEAFLGNHLDSHISKNQWSVTNLSHFDKSIFQIESTGYSVKDSKSQLSSHILRSPRVGSINNPYSHGVFYTESTNYANLSSITGVNIGNFNNLVVSPNLCHAEFGTLQVKKTEYPWLASNLSSETVLSGSLINNSILGANISRTSIIDYNDNGLFTSAQPFRVYEPLDNYTLSTLKNTIESTLQKFKDHNPIQKFSLGFEKGKQITVINIIIIQGDVVGDNHHFGDNIYYLNQ